MYKEEAGNRFGNIKKSILLKREVKSRIKKLGLVCRSFNFHTYVIKHNEWVGENKFGEIKVSLYDSIIIYTIPIVLEKKYFKELLGGKQLPTNRKIRQKFLISRMDINNSLLGFEKNVQHYIDHRWSEKINQVATQSFIYFFKYKEKFYTKFDLYISCKLKKI